MAMTDTPTTAQSLLALYGALDRAVTSTGDPEIEAIVERYLPGSTGANAGWYDELLGFLGHLAPDFAERAAAPNLRDALTVLQNQSETRATSKTEKTRVMAARGDAPPEQKPLTTVQKSRMAYAIGALSHLPRYYQPDGLTEPFSELDDPFAQTLAVAGGPGDSGLLDLLRRDFNDRAAGPQVMQFAARNALINTDVADVPLCQAKLMTVRGHPCVVLTTEFKRTTVSLDDLKDVIDPLNWHRCLSSFFCLMEGKDDRKDGWSRVLEHVSTTCSIPETHMRTPLKYWKGEGQDEQLQQPTAWLDYALDDEPLADAKGDGRMVVDEGFIRMTSTVGDSAEPGVRVRTRKVAGFRDLGWTPWGIFACTMGYGDQGLDMLLDGVKKRPPGGGEGWKDWDPSTPPSASGSAQATGEPAQAAPTVGADTSRRAVELAVDMLNECIDDMSEKSAAIAAKWATGVVPIAETMAFTTDLAARLAADPWRYLERLRYPAQRGDK